MYAMNRSPFTILHRKQRMASRRGAGCSRRAQGSTDHQSACVNPAAKETLSGSLTEIKKAPIDYSIGAFRN